MNLSAMPTANSILSTHLCITIRWWAPPPRYLPVAIGGAAAYCLAGGGVSGRAVAGAAAVRPGGGVAC
jgi:hypothetical protein